MTTVGAVIVTHQSERWIEPLMSSIAQQSRPLDRVVVIDDRSTDGTLALIRQWSPDADILVSESDSNDITTRIAQNFRQGVIACADLDVAVLSDHDDVWSSDRVRHQAALLEKARSAVMVASSGRLVDATGAPLGRTLRDAFPVPTAWNSASAAERMRMAIRRSIATGGACALRPATFAGQAIPAGWLHDRWWSLAATAMEAMLIDDADVIDYRVSDEQQVGLGVGHQQGSGMSRVLAGLGELPRTTRRIGDIRGLRAIATDQTRTELSGTRLLSALL